MSRPRWFFCLAILAVLIPSLAIACLWDYDTLAMERQRFPTALELITGKFLRHSAEFYQWRIADRLRRMESEPANLAYYDDLAVAYEKTGQHDKAIKTMLEKDRLKPRLYETEANLGTFYIHAGQLEKGLQHIERALEINSSAHFGRELYQKLLVEYVVSRRSNGKVPLPLAPVVENFVPLNDFSAFIARGNDSRALSYEERQPGIKGILGMMKFGNHDSPILLEALGNLLTSPYGTERKDAKRLAARAYLKASYEVSDKDVREAYRGLAAAALQMQTRHAATEDQASLEEIENAFQQELADAQAWYAELRANELRWIQEGRNVEQEFDRLYYTEPELLPSHEGEPPLSERVVRPPFVLAVLLIGTAVLSLIIVVLRHRRHSSTPASKSG
jgi:tetratricopeptide (TPR) repeat protein